MGIFRTLFWNWQGIFHPFATLIIITVWYYFRFPALRYAADGVTKLKRYILRSEVHSYIILTSRDFFCSESRCLKGEVHSHLHTFMFLICAKSPPLIFSYKWKVALGNKTRKVMDFVCRSEKKQSCPWRPWFPLLNLHHIAQPGCFHSLGPKQNYLLLKLKHSKEATEQ